MSLPQQYQPFGFSVWFDRHHGYLWCWRERRPKGDPDDMIVGRNYRGRNEAIEGVRQELRRRGQRNGNPDKDGKTG